jgi:hypothetical protein
MTGLAPNPTTELVRYEAAKRALLAAHCLDEVAEIRSKSVAMEAYGRQAKDTELSSKCGKRQRVKRAGASS